MRALASLRRPGILLRALALAVCLGVGPLPWAAPAARGAGAAPVLTIEPMRGRCATDSTRILARGTGFPPDMLIRRSVGRLRDGMMTSDSMAGGFFVGTDGTFAISLGLSGCGPDEPEGSLFLVEVFENTAIRGGGPSSVSVSTIFTVSSAPLAPTGPPNTGGGAAGARVPWPAVPLAVGVLLALVGGTLGRRRTRRARR